MIAQSLEEAEYEPEQFPGLVYRLINPKTATLLFRSGKANCTGAKNIQDVRKTIDIIAEKLREIGMDVQGSGDSCSEYGGYSKSRRGAQSY